MTEAVLAATEAESGSGSPVLLGVGVFVGLVVLLLITLQFDRNR